MAVAVEDNEMRRQDILYRADRQTCWAHSALLPIPARPRPASRVAQKRPFVPYRTSQVSLAALDVPRCGEALSGKLSWPDSVTLPTPKGGGFWRTHELTCMNKRRQWPYVKRQGCVPPKKRFLILCGSNFTWRPARHNRLFEVVKMPHCANAEAILLLTFGAQSYLVKCTI